MSNTKEFCVNCKAEAPDGRVRLCSDHAALPAVAKALCVLVLTPETRKWLEQNDPKALKQAIESVYGLSWVNL